MPQSYLFREYIGTNSKVDVSFTDVPINEKVEFHFIVSSAADYSNGRAPIHTNGVFHTFWKNLSAADVTSIKKDNPNVKVILSLGGDSVHDRPVAFHSTSVDRWVHQAVASLKAIIHRHKMDGIDINFKKFDTTPHIFAKCIGQLITILKADKAISYASIAPTSDLKVQDYYMALWGECGPQLIDFVNFKYNASPLQTDLRHFLEAFNSASANYDGGKVLPGFTSDGSSGLSVDNGFLEACKILKRQKKLHGIFSWSADISMARGTFEYEEEAQCLVENEYPEI